MSQSAGPLLYAGWRSLRSVASWPPERRQMYLVRPDASPISADLAVMPECSDLEMAEPRLFISAWLVPGGSSQVAEEEASGFRQDEAKIPSGHRRSLGFEVCDTALTSLVSNTAWLSGGSAAALFWSLALNRHHLFGALVDAKAFCASASIAVPEHCPIVVVELFAHLSAHETSTSDEGP